MIGAGPLGATALRPYCHNNPIPNSYLMGLPMKSIKKQKLGFHRNNKRLYINAGTITNANLAAGDTVEYVQDAEGAEWIIQKSDTGSHTIASTFKGGVVDINNRAFTEFFKDYQNVEVISEDGHIIVRGHHAESQIKEREETLLRRVETGEPLRKGGAFAGLGLLCRSIHRGIKQSGVAVKQRFANEYNPIPAEVNMAGNEIWDDATDDAVFSIDDIYTLNMDIVPKLDILVMGSPCPAFSQANTTLKKEGKTDIFHPVSGTIFQPILEMIRRSNPAVVVLENAKFFEGSIFDYIMSDVMARYGYEKQSVVVTGQQFGDFEKRERICRVWRSKGLPEINLDSLPFQQENATKFGEILEPIANDDSRWARREYLEAKDAEAHNGHKYCITSLDAIKVPTCGANYHKIQADSIMIAHPERELITRIMTPSEHCNLRDIAGPLKENILAVEKGEHYAQQGSRGSISEAHRMLGNSCSPKPWTSVGYRLGEWMQGLTQRMNDVTTTVTQQVATITKVEGPCTTEHQLGLFG